MNEKFVKAVGHTALWLEHKAVLNTEVGNQKDVEDWLKSFNGDRKALKSELSKYVASTVVVLGGVNRLKAMLNARDYQLLPLGRGGFAFKFSGNPDYNYIEIYCNSLDLMNLRVGYIRAGKVSREVIKENIYIEDLKNTVEQTIQLYLSL